MVISPSPCKQQKNTPDYIPLPSDISPSIAVLVGKDTNRLEINLRKGFVCAQYVFAAIMISSDRACVETLFLFRL